ncbi:MAG: glycosyltransferase family 2 protein [Campylobacteraceae bacterium]|nr:glycosyltransferase family 2 protein [Campylobacteraceae bacterium]
MSIIIITLNDPNLAKLLTQIFALNFDGEFEVIIVNAGEPLSLENKKIKVIENAPRNRGLQLNLGANLAKFETLWFLHSDSSIDKNSLNLISSALRSSEIGCFRVKFDKGGFFMKFIELGSNLRVIFRNIAFGDQGIFIKKSLFESLGKFREIPIMEDYDFSMKVKESGYKFKLANGYITTSARRFKNPLKTLFKMQVLQYKFRKERKKANLKMEKFQNEYQKI